MNERCRISNEALDYALIAEKAKGLSECICNYGGGGDDIPEVSRTDIANIKACASQITMLLGGVIFFLSDLQDRVMEIKECKCGKCRSDGVPVQEG